MFEDIFLNETKKNFFQINLKEGDEVKNLVYFSKNNFVPFGLEEYKNKYCINFEVSNQSEFYKLIRKLDNE